MPNYESKRVICLANSDKIRGRCVAGKEILSDGSVGGWIRPVSDRPDEEVSENESRYKDGGEPRVLDVIEIPLKNALPNSFQKENWLLDPNDRWKKIDSVSWDDLSALADNPAALWINGCSTANGKNDRIPTSRTGDIESSLYLVRLSSLELSVFAGYYPYDPRRVQGRFQYGGEDYSIRVTDPRYRQEYRRMPIGSHSDIGECFLTISLGTNFHGYAYKLIAAIIEPQ